MILFLSLGTLAMVDSHMNFAIALQLTGNISDGLLMTGLCQRRICLEYLKAIFISDIEHGSLLCQCPVLLPSAVSNWLLVPPNGRKQLVPCRRFVVQERTVLRCIQLYRTQLTSISRIHPSSMFRANVIMERSSNLYLQAVDILLILCIHLVSDLTKYDSPRTERAWRVCVLFNDALQDIFPSVVFFGRACYAVGERAGSTVTSWFTLGPSPQRNSTLSLQPESHCDIFTQ